LKNNGSMYINELILSNKILRKLIYYITLLLSKKGINIPYIYINKGVIVNFMTEDFFKKLLENLSLNSKLIYKKLWKIRYIKVGYLKQYIVTSKS